MVGVLDGRAEDREDRVTDELVDGPAVLDDDVGHPPEVLVEHLHDTGGVAVLGKPRVAAEIGHEDRDLALVAAQAQPVGRLQQGARDLGRHVAAEGVTDEVALAQPLDHLVEGARELADLVARAHRQRLVEIAGGHAADGAGERADRPRQPPGEHDTQRQRHRDGGQRALEDRRVQLVEPIQEDVDRIVDVEHGDGPAPGIEDRRHRAHARPGRRAMNAGVARHAVLEAPRDRVGQLRRDRKPLARPLVAAAGDDDARAPRHRIVVGERADRRRQQRLGADRRQRLLDAAVRGRGRIRPALQPGVERGIDQQHAGARDVQELGADGVLDLALLADVHQRADQPGRETRQQREDHREADGEALPGPKRRRGERAPGRRVHAPHGCRIAVVTVVEARRAPGRGGRPPTTGRRRA